MNRRFACAVLVATCVPMSGCLLDPFGIFGGDDNGGGGRPRPATDAGSGSDGSSFVFDAGGSPPPSPEAGSGTDGGTPPSGGVTTSGPLDVHAISAEMSAQSYGDTVTLYATLRHDKFYGDPAPDDVVLSDGDTLQGTLTHMSAFVTMEREPNTNAATVRYFVTFPMQPNVSAPFDAIIAFDRTNGKVGAPYSRVTLAVPFAITKPPPATFKVGDMVPIAISPPIDTSIATPSFELFSPTPGCLNGVDWAATFDANGAATFDSSKMTFATNPPPAAGCDITWRVRADSTTGQVDSAFQRGTFGGISAMQGVQARDAPSHVNP